MTTCAPEEAAASPVVLGVRDDVLAVDILDRDILDVEPMLSPCSRCSYCISIDFTSVVILVGEGDHTGLDDNSLDTTDWDCSNIVNPVHIQKRETRGFFIGRAGGRFNDHDDFQKGLTLTALSWICLVQPCTRARWR